MRYPLLKSTKHEPMIELPYGNYSYHPNPTEEEIHFIIQPPNNKDPQIMVIALMLFLKSMRRKSTLFLANLYMTLERS